ncbi:unnamed protein product, partial [Adineta ricciae]
ASTSTKQSSTTPSNAIHFPHIGIKQVLISRVFQQRFLCELFQSRKIIF